MMPTRALSVRQPWVWAILYGGKDVENRDWKPSNPCLKYRGPVFIHSSLKFNADDVPHLRKILSKAGRDPRDLPENIDAFPRGGIVGRMDIVGVVTKSDSPWFFGHPPHFGLVIENAQPLPFRPLRGQVGLFGVSNE